MASEIQVCNLALSRVGAYRIQSLDDATKEARECKLFYPFSRDAVLRDHDWGFARKRVSLALLSETWSGWDYAYQYPVDCLVARKITPDAETETGDKVEFEISSNDSLSRRVILTNKEDAELVYTAKVEDVNLFDAIFTDALAWRLASELAIPLKAKADLQNVLFQKYIFVLGRAEAINSNEGEKKPDHDNRYVGARS